jgi:hypothetical protein
MSTEGKEAIKNGTLNSSNSSSKTVINNLTPETSDDDFREYLNFLPYR